MRKPVIGKPRSSAKMASLSARLPKLKLPASSLTTATSSRPRPNVGRVGPKNR